MSTLKTKFGNRLRDLRYKRRCTQEMLADQTGLTVESISNIERGIYGPKFENLEKLANALGMEVKDLFDFV